MASVIIHLAIAKELDKRLNLKSKYDYYLGAIAPDIAKQIGISWDEAHFSLGFRRDTPNLELFKQRYPDYKENAFTLGYYTHLVADKEWSENFMEKLRCGDFIKLLDGTIIKSDQKEILDLIYSDYTNLNKKVIEEYDLDLSLFYEDFRKPKVEFKEIPVEKLDILINKMGILIENSKGEKTYTLDMDQIKLFVSDVVNRLEKELEII